MPEMSSCTVNVSDPNGGAAFRPFTFSSSQQGDTYTVSCLYDGGGPLTYKLTRSAPSANVNATGARVYPQGTLTMIFGAASDPNVAIKFDGTLWTNAPTKLQSVIVALFD
jgi:hypothetical protein